MEKYNKKISKLELEIQLLKEENEKLKEGIIANDEHIFYIENEMNIYKKKYEKMEKYYNNINDLNQEKERNKKSNSV